MTKNDFQIEGTWIRTATGRDSQTFNICRPSFHPREGQGYEQIWKISEPNPFLTARRYEAAPTVEALVKLVIDAGGVQVA